MLGGLLGRKFPAKCKHSIKCTKARVLERRKKKQALLNFLKKDIADLLAIDEDRNAFGRMDGLILQMNHVACYDMIEKFCEHILSLLPTLQKQKECPEEAMEAVATLIYAAARFSDLPELCDLRRVFTARYGSTMEPSLNQEVVPCSPVARERVAVFSSRILLWFFFQFVEGVSKKTFSKERKLKMMQEIAKEFSVKWDLKYFEQKKPALFKPDQSRMDSHSPESKQKQGNSSNQPPSIVQTPAVTAKKQAVCPVANEVHVIAGSTKQCRAHELGMKESSDARMPLGLKKAHSPDNRVSEKKQANAGSSQSSSKAPPYVKQREHRYEDRSTAAIENPSPRTDRIKVSIVASPHLKDIGLKAVSAAEEKKPVAARKLPDELNATPAINRIPPYFKAGVADGGLNRNVDSPKIAEEANGKPRSVRRNKQESLNQGGEVAMDVDERIDRIVYGRGYPNRRGTRSFDADREEEVEIDKLLMHYSTKGGAGALPDKPRMARRDRPAYRDVQIVDRAFARVTSLPPERNAAAVESADCARGPKQAHPRLPDYDELAARFNALKRS